MRLKNLFRSADFTPVPGERAMEVFVPFEKLEVSPGLVSAYSLKNLRLRYDLNAYIPKPDWRKLTLEETEALKPIDCAGPNNSIHLVKVPTEVLKSFKATRLENVRSTEEFGYYSTQDPCKNSIQEITSYLQKYQLPETELQGTSFVINPPELQTLTVNTWTGRFLGLHVDSWDGLPAVKRQNATNRICLNLGKEPRYLLFMNLKIERVWELMQATHGTSAPHLLVEEFLKRAGSFPVYRLPIEPGEAYIAPTENMIHDASTIGKKYPDLQLTLRGRFTPVRCE